jgi:pteridine reductase
MTVCGEPAVFGKSKPVVLVTGSGAARVGRTVAEQFSRRGYRVVLHAHRSVAEAETLLAEWERDGTEGMVVRGPIEQAEVVQSWVESIVRRFGSLDCLVHTAAVWDPQPLEVVEPEELARQVTVNALGSYLCAQRCGLQMVQQASGGAIVLVGDWATARPYRDFSAYFLSKGGIPTLTRSMAVELAERNPKVRVNAVLPGPILLPEQTPDAVRRAIKAEALLQCEGTAEHLAQAAVFLAEHTFLTGVCLPVDGGRTIWGGVRGDAIAHPQWQP